MSDDAFKPKSEFLQVMQARGYVHQASDIEALDRSAFTSGVDDGLRVVGYDCTADSLHIGQPRSRRS